MRARTSRHLAEAAGEVAREREEERGQAERLERDDVEDEAGPEAGDGAEDRPAQERDPDDEDEQDVGVSRRDLDRWT